MCNIVYYDRIFHFQLFWLGGAAKSGEEEEHAVTELMNDWMMCLFVDRPWLRPATKLVLKCRFQRN